MNWVEELLDGNIEGLEAYIAEEGGDINDIDPYGFTPLIEATIADKIEVGQAILDKGAQINKPDVTGRTALHWTIDNGNLAFSEMLLQRRADPNAYTRAGQPLLIYPLLRQQKALKELLYRYNANLSFAQDFINTKLLGHRFQLTGDVDIVNAAGEFIEVDFEGFILEFTLEVLKNSLTRYKNNFAARHMRPYFDKLALIMKSFENASQLLKYQHSMHHPQRYATQIKKLLTTSPLLLPIAYEGHAISIMVLGEYLAKCDRGENSLREGTVNIYRVQRLKKLNEDLFGFLLYKQQSESFIHHQLNQVLELQPLCQLPISPQISGNCSWANIEASVPIMHFLLALQDPKSQGRDLNELIEETMYFYRQWHTWDQDRALNECIQDFAKASPSRQASKAAILGTILFQSCKYGNKKDMDRADKILKILTLPQYTYILNSYIKVYYQDKKTAQGSNLLNILDDCGIYLEDMEVASPLGKQKD